MTVCVDRELGICKCPLSPSDQNWDTGWSQHALVCCPLGVAHGPSEHMLALGSSLLSLFLGDSTLCVQEPSAGCLSVPVSTEERAGGYAPHSDSWSSAPRTVPISFHSAFDHVRKSVLSFIFFLIN